MCVRASSESRQVAPLRNAAAGFGPAAAVLSVLPAEVPPARIPIGRTLDYVAIPTIVSATEIQRAPLIAGTVIVISGRATEAAPADVDRCASIITGSPVSPVAAFRGCAVKRIASLCADCADGQECNCD